jgi:hypothetical protein
VNVACKGCSITTLTLKAREGLMHMQNVASVFKKKWGLVYVDPALTIRQMITFEIHEFVELKQLQKGQTLAGLALQHSTSEMKIRILNNLLSERALSAYSSLYVPMSNPSCLQGKHLELRAVGAMNRPLPVCGF